MDEKTVNQINQALTSALIAFQSINAPMTMKNVQYGNVVIGNIQSVLQTLQDQNKKMNDKVIKGSDAD